MRANRPTVALIAAIAIAYGLGNHWLMVSSGGVGWGAELSLLPVAALACWLGLRARGSARWSALAGSIALLALLVWSRRHSGPNLALLVPQVAGCLLVAALFGGSLLPGNEPILTRVARLVHGEITAAHAAYARRV